MNKLQNIKVVFKSMRIQLPSDIIVPYQIDKMLRI